MVIMSGTATVLQQFVSGLKSRNEDTRAKSAKDLQHYVTTELREVTAKINTDVIESCHEGIISYTVTGMSVVVLKNCKVISCLQYFRSGCECGYKYYITCAGILRNVFPFLRDSRFSILTNFAFPTGL